jgi:hypothetical protein
MGMYTELDIKLPINPEKVQELMRILPYLLSSTITVENLPDHPFFKCERAPGFLNRGNGMTKPDSYLKHIYDDMYYLFVGTCLKNYSEEIIHFLDWIIDFTIQDGTDEYPSLVGTYRYEEDRFYSSVFQVTNGFKIMTPTNEE